MDDVSKEVLARERSRRYRSPRRQEQALQTRRRILSAAHQEFLGSGYARTTMVTIAARAGVSAAAVEKVFGTKAALLKSVIDVAIAGDDHPVPVLGRHSAAHAEAACDVAEFLDRVADILGTGQQRSARLVCVLFEAAAGDAALQLLAGQRLAERRIVAEWIVAGFVRYCPLRSGLDRADAVDIVWVLMEPVSYCRLTQERHWTVTRYQQWFADSVVRLLGGVSGEDSRRAH